MAEQPTVSIVMPVRNEAAFIGQSLASVLAQDYPMSQVEILVVDGMSEDGTRQIVEEFVRRSSEVEPQRTQRIGEPGAESQPSPNSELFVRSVVDYPVNIRLLDNPGRIVPTGMNIALGQARGDIIVRIDGHCEIAPDYVRRCVEHIAKDGVDGVGGSVDTVGGTRTAAVIAAAMSTRFGVGDSAFRTRSGKTALADTIPFPAYTRSIIRMAGGYDEELVRCQDDEYNYRLRELGAKLLLAADVRSKYYSRASLRSLWKQYFQYGFWKVRVMQKHPKQMRVRQFVPPSFVLCLCLSLCLAAAFRWGWIAVVLVGGGYMLANLAASALTASRRGWRYLPRLTVVYAILHLSYGFGFLSGLFRFWHRWGDKKGRVPEVKPREAVRE